MPCYIRMKITFLQGLLWLYLLGFGFMALSLEPGYLDFDNLPDTNFSCVGKVIGGYYADLETNCQMFHVCTIGQLDEPMDIRFLCLNGTVFDQETRVCERIDEVDCSKSEQFYSLNLELYGNTQPATLEESPETEQPLIIRPTTTTTTTTQAPKPKTTRAPFYTTAATPRATTPNQVISTNRFPVVNSPDIRFNPEEINISLHPGAPPDIRTKPVTFLQHSYSDNNKKVVVTTHSETSDNKMVTVTTHSPVFDDEKVLSHQEQGFIERPQVQVTNAQEHHADYNYAHSDDESSKDSNHPTPGDINFGFTFHKTEPSEEYHTEDPQDYHFHSDFRAGQEYSGHHHHHPHSHQFKSNPFEDDYITTTLKVNNNFQQKSTTTVRNYFLESLKPPPPNQHHHYNQHRTENPEKLQLPIPLLPTLPPLTFSTPAPFSLQHHIDTKRYTKDHQAPPRIIISASASVSDASGRRLNYSLGTIGAAEILEEPPSSYDEYKEEDVGLDPFYHDVPKIKRSRRKRNAEPKIKHTDIIRNEQEAVDVLKFLLDWYKLNEKTAVESTTMPSVPTSSEAVTVNQEITPITPVVALEEKNETKDVVVEQIMDTDEYNFKNSDLFNRKSKYSIIGSTNENDRSEEENNSDQSLQSISTKKNSKANTNYYFLGDLFQLDEDYVNDNFEPIAYDEKYGSGLLKSDKGRSDNLIKPPTEENKNRSTPADYVDDNIEPIYYREGNVKEEGILKIDENKESNTLSFVGSNENRTSQERTGVNNKEFNQSGDIETNNVNRELNDALPSSSNETTTANANNSGLKPSESSLRSRNGRRKGNRKSYNNGDKNKNETKNVLIDRLTEKAHTAKDDFNYLRTLYKVYSTTPMYNISDEASPYIKIQKTTTSHLENKDIYSSYVDIPAETRAESKEDESFTEIISVPIITTEQTATSTSSPRKGNRRRGSRQQDRGSNRKKLSVRNNFNRRKSTTPKPTEETEEKSSTLETSSISYVSNNSTVAIDMQTTENINLTVANVTSNNDTVPISDLNIPPTLEITESTLIVTNATSNDTIPKSELSISPNLEVTEANLIIANTTNDDIIPKSDQAVSSNLGLTGTNLTVTNVMNNDTVLKIDTTITPDVEITESNPRASTIADSLESQTTFLTQLTQSYKKLFGVLLNPVETNGQFDPTTGFRNIKYLGTPQSTSTESLESKNIKLNSFLSAVTTPSQEGDRNKIVDTYQGPTTVEQPFNTSPSSSEIIQKGQSSPTPANHPKLRTGSTIPTTFSELYKEVNIEPFNDTKLLTNKTAYDSKGTVSTENYPLTPATQEEHLERNINPMNIFIEEIITSKEYENSESPTTENLPTTQLTTERNKGEEEEEMTFKTEATGTTEEVPEQHVVQENRHYHNSFTQTFIFTEDLKEIPEPGADKDMTQKNMPTTQLTTESVQPTENNTTTIPEGSTSKNFEVSTYKTGQDQMLEDLTTTQMTIQGTEQMSTENSISTISTDSTISDDSTSTESNKNIQVPKTLTGEAAPTTQLIIEKLEQFIKEIEVTTKSVVVDTEIPLISKTETEEVARADGTEGTLNKNLEKIIEELITTTGKIEDLQELVDEIQQITKSKMDTATMSEIVPNQVVESPKEEGDHTTFSEIPSTLELTTSLPANHDQEDVTTTQSIAVVEPTTQTDSFTTTEKLTTVEEPATTSTVAELPTTTTLKQITTEEVKTADEESVTATLEKETTTEETVTTTTEVPTTSAVSRRIAKQMRRYPRPPRRRISSNFQKNTTRHRFSTETFTRRPEGRQQTIEEEILDEIVRNSQESTTEPLRPLRRRNRNRKRIESFRQHSTDAPLHKSASPTQAERVRESLPTTPLSKTATTRKYFIFNCFGKKVDKFYPDPRDCRLFHYCTRGYNRHQLLDMKFVCDFNTYFDDEKLICTKRKPRRCM